MRHCILYPGQDWRGSVLNTLDKTLADKSDNKNYPTYTDNASKSSLTWAKYLDPIDQYPNMWSTGTCVIVFRYAEVLLSYAEAENELNGPLYRIVGTIDYNETDPYKRAVVTGKDLIENREFAAKNRYLPIPQDSLDKNPNLKQNSGY